MIYETELTTDSFILCSNISHITNPQKPLHWAGDHISDIYTLKYSQNMEGIHILRHTLAKAHTLIHKTVKW